MKKLLPVLCGVLLVLALAFFGLWRQAVDSRDDDLYQLWDSAAIQADQLLMEYAQTGDETLLAQAAAEMNVLNRVAAMLPEVDTAARSDLSAVCGILLLYPQRGGGQGGPYNCAEWIVAVELMQNEGPESTGRNWPVKMNELRHLLEGSTN